MVGTAFESPNHELSIRDDYLSDSLTVHLEKWEGQNSKWKNAILKKIDETSKPHRFFSIHSTNKPKVWNDL